MTCQIEGWKMFFCSWPTVSTVWRIRFTTFSPRAAYQHCSIHVSRDIAIKVAYRNEIWENFKAVYQAYSREKGREAFQAFSGKWHISYSRLVKSLLENNHLLTFYDFPVSIRSSVFSTNLIESLNNQIKNCSRHKEQFQNEDSMDRFLVSIFDTYNQFFTRIHRGF